MPRGRQIVQAPVSWTLTPKGAKALRARHDGFDPKKQRRFIKTLRKTGCVRDAARVAGVSTETAYRTRRRLPEFRKKWETALRMAASDIEMLAWERAVDGAEITTMRGGEIVSVTRKPSDTILRLLMQGSNPEKYGRTAAVRPAKAAPPSPAERERQSRQWLEDENAVAAEIERRLNIIEALGPDDPLPAEFQRPPLSPEEQAEMDAFIVEIERRLHVEAWRAHDEGAAA